MIETGMLFALFPSFLGPLKEQKERQDFLLFAAALDSLRLSEIPVPDEFYLALSPASPPIFLSLRGISPWSQRAGRLSASGPEMGVGHPGSPSFSPPDQGRGHEFLSAQRIFQEFRPGEKLPPRLVRKVFFQPAFHLFELGAKVGGRSPSGSTGCPRKSRSTGGKESTGPGKRKDGEPGEPAVEGIPPGHQNP